MPDGSIVPWDYDTATKIAMLLTVDKNGKDATDPAFDPENIVQWGFEPQRDDLRQVGAYWKAGQFAPPTARPPQIPAAWAESWKWFYDGIWKDHISMTGPQFLSTDLNPDGYPFFTGNVAMSENYLWSTYGVADAGDDWNMAATPSYEGQTTAAFNADTFRILKSSKHPDEAFDGADLPPGRRLGATPAGLRRHARTRGRAGRLLRTSPGDYTQTIDWQVAKDGVAYADVPNFESYMPAYNESLDLINTFGTKWQATPGLDMDKEIQDLRPSSRRSGTRRTDRSSRDRPVERRRRRPASAGRLGWPGAASALGLRLHLALDRRVLPVHARSRWSPRSSSRSPTSTSPGRAAPVRRARELRPLLGRHQAWRVAARDPQVRADRAAGRGAPAVPGGDAAQLAPPAWRVRLPGPVLPAVRRPVRGRRPDLAADAGGRRLGQRRAAGHRDRQPARLAQDPTWIYPALVIMGIWGIGAGIIVYLAGLKGIPTELYDAANIDGAGWWAQLRNITSR